MRCRNNATITYLNGCVLLEVCVYVCWVLVHFDAIPRREAPLEKWRHEEEEEAIQTRILHHRQHMHDASSSFCNNEQPTTAWMCNLYLFVQYKIFSYKRFASFALCCMRHCWTVNKQTFCGEYRDLVFLEYKLLLLLAAAADQSWSDRSPQTQ